MAKVRKKPVLGLGQWSVIINEGKWIPRDFDLIIIEFLNYAMQGKVSKLMVGVPPRHGKSTLISRNFCSYFMTHFPNEKVILSSYSQDLAQEFGSDVKNIVDTYGYLAPHNVTLSKHSKANKKFKITEPYEGRMLSVGAGGSILGFGAGLFIIDDPIKTVAEAQSEILQGKLREWFGATAKTRLEKRTNGLPPIMIIIAQRLHVNDLQGIIQATEPYIDAKEALELLRKGETLDPNLWVNINLPAICEFPETDLLGRKAGQVLWEEQRDIEWLLAEKKAMGSYLFNAVYQGNPHEREGFIFKRAWFYDERTGLPDCIIPKSEIPEDLPKLRYWDFAANAKRGGRREGDETSGVLTGFDGETIYVLDLINGNFTANEVSNIFGRTVKKDGRYVNTRIEEEPGSGSRLLIDKFMHDPEFRRYKIRGDKVRYAKNVRSFTLEGICENRNFKMVEATWNQKMLDQLINFTGTDGNSDDIVDSLTGSANIWCKPKAKLIVG